MKHFDNPWRMLKDMRPYITKQEYRTIKGQLIAGDKDGAVRGLIVLYGRAARGGAV